MNDTYCPICGAPMEWQDCPAYCNEGYTHDIDADGQHCGEPYRCGECNGTGGYLECTAVPHTDEQMRAWRKRMEQP